MTDSKKMYTYQIDKKTVTLKSGTEHIDILSGIDGYLLKQSAVSKQKESPTSAADLQIACWPELQAFRDWQAQPDGIPPLLFPSENNHVAGENPAVTRAIPVLSILFCPLGFLHDHAAALNIDNRVGILDHSIWHRALVLPAELERLIPTIKSMLTDWRLDTTVAFEGRYMLRNSFKGDVPRISLPIGHAETYRVSFIPRPILKREIKRLLNRFAKHCSDDNANHKKIILIDDHADSLRTLTGKKGSFGKKHTIWQAFAEACESTQPSAEKPPDCWKEAAPSLKTWSWKAYTHFKGYIADEFYSSTPGKVSGEPVLLLDFLFTDEHGPDHLGTTLIKRLVAPLEGDGINAIELPKIIDRGPFAIFFVSSFAWAIREELDKGTFTLHAGSVYVDLGQDPVCYPEIFVKKLLQFVLSREIRPLMHALEIIEQEEDRLLAIKINDEIKDNKCIEECFGSLGIIASYGKNLEDIRNKCMLEEGQPVWKLATKIIKTSKEVQKIHRCIGRYLYAGPEDCRLVRAELEESWPKRLVEPLNFVNKSADNKNITKHLALLRKKIINTLDKHITQF